VADLLFLLLAVAGLGLCVLAVRGLDLRIKS